MYDTYFVLIMIASILVGFITSCRIGHIMITKAQQGSDGEKGFVAFVCGAIAAVMMGFQTYAALFYFGLFGGLVSVVLTVPAVGLCWVYVVGGNLAAKRLLDRLCTRVD